MDASASLTDMIRRAQTGDASALKDVFEAAYQELRGLARARLRKGAPQGLLGTTALVHEAYLRFAQAGRLRLEDRQHFLKYASHVMRSVIVDFVRERIAQRRGGDATHVTLNPEVISSAADGEREIMQVHDALEELAQLDARLGPESDPGTARLCARVDGTDVRGTARHRYIPGALRARTCA